MTRVKICGIRDLHEARWAVEQGAWAIGQIFAPSRRQISHNTAQAINLVLGSSVVRIGVFVNEDLDRLNATAARCRLDMVQLHGDESPEYCREVQLPVIKAFRPRGPVKAEDLERWPVRACLFDAGGPSARSEKGGKLYGGTGTTFNHDWIQDLAGERRLIVAGGLNPGNVARVVNRLRPLAVDVSSGVEFPEGGKDPALIRLFMQQVKEANQNASTASA